MSRYKTSLIVLSVGIATLLLPGSARGQEADFFEGCGTLTLLGGKCVLFFPDNGEFPNGLGRFGGWGDVRFGQRLHITGELVACGGICPPDGCFDVKTSVIGACIPTVSHWGLVVLTLLLLVAATILIRRVKRFRYAAGAFALLVLCALGTPTRGEDPAITEKVNSMLAYPHGPEHLVVRFVQGTPEATRDALHAAAGAVKVKSYRFVDKRSVRPYHVSCLDSQLV